MSENEAATGITTQGSSDTVAGAGNEKRDQAGITESTSNSSETASNNTQVAHDVDNTHNDDLPQAQTAANELLQPELEQSQDQAAKTATNDTDKQQVGDDAQSPNDNAGQTPDPPAAAASDLAAGDAARPAGSETSVEDEQSSSAVQDTVDPSDAQAPSDTIATPSGPAPPAAGTSQSISTSQAAPSTSEQGPSTSNTTAVPSSTSIQRSSSSSGTATATAAGAAGSGSSSTTTSTATRPATTKKFTSSLSMNKKFLEK